MMKKLSMGWLAILLLLGACRTLAPPEAPFAVLPKSDFSRFSLVRLTPTMLPRAMNRLTASKKSAAQLDRELVIRLSKCLKKQKISPTSDHISTSMLNITPQFKANGQGLVLVVTFQNNVSGENIATQTFQVSNTWKHGFKNSDIDRVLLANLAQQVVNYMMRSQ